MTVSVLLIGAAFVCAIANALGKCPAWVALILLCVVLLLKEWPR